MKLKNIMIGIVLIELKWIFIGVTIGSITTLLGALTINYRLDYKLYKQ